MEHVAEITKLLLICGTLIVIAGGVLLSMPQSKLRDFLMPIVAWTFALCCGAYIISPLDVVPDVVPFAGWIDDAGALVAGIAAARSAITAGKNRNASQ